MSNRLFRQIRNVEEFLEDFDYDQDPFEAFLHRVAVDKNLVEVPSR